MENARRPRGWLACAVLFWVGLFCQVLGGRESLSAEAAWSSSSYPGLQHSHPPDIGETLTRGESLHPLWHPDKIDETLTGPGGSLERDLFLSEAATFPARRRAHPLSSLHAARGAERSGVPLVDPGLTATAVVEDAHRPAALDVDANALLRPSPQETVVAIIFLLIVTTLVTFFIRTVTAAHSDHVQRSVLINAPGGRLSDVNLGSVKMTRDQAHMWLAKAAAPLNLYVLREEDVVRLASQLSSLEFYVRDAELKRRHSHTGVVVPSAPPAEPEWLGYRRLNSKGTQGDSE